MCQAANAAAALGRCGAWSAQAGAQESACSLQHDVSGVRAGREGLRLAGGVGDLDLPLKDHTLSKADILAGHVQLLALDERGDAVWRLYLYQSPAATLRTITPPDIPAIKKTVELPFMPLEALGAVLLTLFE